MGWGGVGGGRMWGFRSDGACALRRAVGSESDPGQAGPVLTPCTHRVPLCVKGGRPFYRSPTRRTDRRPRRGSNTFQCPGPLRVDDPSRLRRNDTAANRRRGRNHCAPSASMPWEPLCPMSCALLQWRRCGPPGLPGGPPPGRPLFYRDLAR